MPQNSKYTHTQRARTQENKNRNVCERSEACKVTYLKNDTYDLLQTLHKRIWAYNEIYRRHSSVISYDLRLDRIMITPLHTRSTCLHLARLRQICNLKVTSLDQQSLVTMLHLTWSLIRRLLQRRHFVNPQWQVISDIPNSEMMDWTWIIIDKHIT